jgi:hypothetical protein
MNKWFEIFKAGKQTSSSGQIREWSQADLDHMVTSYDPELKAAPLVVGHPKQNDPAYGWVDKLKRVGNLLMALPKQVDPQFSEMVKTGRFPKRSISVYPDGTIRHVGFLGAMPPAVKGLKDVEFVDDPQAETYDYGEEATMPTLEELQLQLDEEKRKRLEAEEKVKSSEANFAEQLKKARHKEVADFVEAGIKKGKILPAWKKDGLTEFMQGLDGDEETFEFSEGKEQTRGEWFKGFIDSFSAHPLFKEMARPDGDKDKSDADFAEDEKLAEEMAAGHSVKK